MGIHRGKAADQDDVRLKSETLIRIVRHLDVER
jgi:hypothetical protein